MENSKSSTAIMTSNDALGWIFLAILLILVVAGVYFWFKRRTKIKPHRSKQVEKRSEKPKISSEVPELNARFEEIPARLALLQQNNLNTVANLAKISDELEVLSQLIAALGRKVASIKAQNRVLEQISIEITNFSYDPEKDMEDFARWLRIASLAAEVGASWSNMVAIPPGIDWKESWQRIAWSAQSHCGTLRDAINGYNNLGMMLSSGYVSTNRELSELERRLTMTEAQIPIFKIRQSLLSIEKTMGILAPQHGFTSQLLDGGTVLEIPQQTYKMLEQAQ